MQLLVAYGADVGLCDHDGRSVLHWTAKLKSPDCLEHLLSHAFK